MNTPEHEYPKPMWRKRADGSVAIRYANDKMDYSAHSQNGPRGGDVTVPVDGYGWSQNYIKQEFPKAVHGPNGQSVRVNTPEELESRLAAGWSLKPVGTEVPKELRNVDEDANLPPHGLNDKKNKKREEVNA